MPILTIAQPSDSNKSGIWKYNCGGSVDCNYINLASCDGLKLQYTEYMWTSGLQYYQTNMFLRFKLPLKKVDTINSAFIRFKHIKGVKPNPGGRVNAVINAHKHTNSPGPLTQADCVAQSITNPTSNFANWHLPASNALCYTKFSTDISKILRELIDQSGWVKDNYICLYLRCTDTTAPSSADFVNESFQTCGSQVSECHLGTTSLPHLVIDYTEGTEGSDLGTKHVEHTLVIEQDIVGRMTSGHVEHTLTIEQDITRSVVRNRTVFSDLTIEHFPRVAVPFERSYFDLLVFEQLIDRGLVRPKSVEHELNITQDIIRNTKFDKQIVHEIVVENDQVEFSRGYSKTVEHTVNIEHEVSTNIKTRHVESTIDIQQDAEFDGTFAKPKHVEHQLVIQQDISTGVNRTRGIEHELTIGQSIVGWLNSPTQDGSQLQDCDRYDINYSPAADASINFPPKPVLTSPANITLQHPPTAPTSTLTLPVPLLADREELQYTRIQRKTRGGVLKVFRDEDWLKIRTFRFKFEGLSDAEIDSVFTFFSTTLGLKVRLTDHEGRQWDGYIVNPQGEASQFFRMCGETTEFDFEGTLV